MNKVIISGVVTSNNQSIYLKGYKYNLVRVFNLNGEFVVAIKHPNEVCLGDKVQIIGHLDFVLIKHAKYKENLVENLTDTQPASMVVVVADSVKPLSKLTSQSHIELDANILNSSVVNGKTKLDLSVTIGSTELVIPSQVNSCNLSNNTSVQVAGTLQSLTFDKNGFMQYIIDVTNIKQTQSTNKEFENE